MSEDVKSPPDITGVNIQISGKAPRLAEDSHDAMKRRERESSFSSAEVNVGVQIGEYLVEAPIAAGAMGEVWKAKHPVIGKHAAIKILGQDIFVNKEAIARFIQEARAVNEIRHRNIIDIFSFGELSDGRPYLVMEYLDGQPLSQYLREKTRLPFATIANLLDQICRALSAAHERGIVHRDLKPENIFLVIERRAPLFVKILDFGLAKLLGDQSSGKKELTRPGAVYGTPSYMSPEQCQSAAKTDHCSDIYSLGIILFEMICGRVPYPFNEAEGVGMTMVNHMTAPIPNVSEFASDREIPPAVDAFLTRMLAKKKEARPQSCEAVYDEFLVALGSLKHEEEIQPKKAPEPVLQKPTDTPVEVSAVGAPEEHKEAEPQGQFAEAPTMITSMDYFSRTMENPIARPYEAPEELPTPKPAPKPSNKMPILLAAGAITLIGAGASLLLSTEPEPKQTTTPIVQVTSTSAPVEPTPTTAASTPSEQNTVMVEFISKPKGAKVFQDKVLLGVTPFTTKLPQSDDKLSLRFEKLGFTQADTTLITSQTQKVELELTPAKSVINKTNNTKTNDNKTKDGSKITINPFDKK
jgi:serine/threonine protein kinase